MMENHKGFSFEARKEAIKNFRSKKFDLLIVGGGITGAAVARDATSRGLQVALIEKRDFAFGTSSRSSKLIHGGLRYLQNMELGLVFEALAERSFFLKSVPHLVQPLPFYYPVYEADSRGRGLMGIGLWLYDLLALFRTPEFHKGLSKTELLKEIPFLKNTGLVGGFRYYDASMQDDVMVLRTLRSAHDGGAQLANYVEAQKPIWDGEQIAGFRVKDHEDSSENSEFNILAHQTIVCAGPWLDELGKKMAPQWDRWLTPSKGVHLVFDLKRIPVPGAMVMTHDKDGRIAFVIPRRDMGEPIAIVGTTDGPTPLDPDAMEVTENEVTYLMEMLQRYFPDLKLTHSDILSAYVGVRPLMNASRESSTRVTSEGKKDVKEGAKKDSSSVLQKVSREHHIDHGPGGTVLVAGGKYTTHRTMAKEIVEFTLKKWHNEVRSKPGTYFPSSLGPRNVDSPLDPEMTAESVIEARGLNQSEALAIPEYILNRFGMQAIEWSAGQKKKGSQDQGQEAARFYTECQLRYSIDHEMVLHLEDFYFRRAGLYMTRKDHGLPWASALSAVLVEKLPHLKTSDELVRLDREIAHRGRWKKSVK